MTSAPHPYHLLTATIRGGNGRLVYLLGAVWELADENCLVAGGFSDSEAAQNELCAAVHSVVFSVV